MEDFVSQRTVLVVVQVQNFGKALSWDVGIALGLGSQVLYTFVSLLVVTFIHIKHAFFFSDLEISSSQYREQQSGNMKTQKHTKRKK